MDILGLFRKKPDNVSLSKREVEVLIKKLNANQTEFCKGFLAAKAEDIEDLEIV